MTFENEEGYKRALEFHELTEGEENLEIHRKWLGDYELEI